MKLIALLLLLTTTASAAPCPCTHTAVRRTVNTPHSSRATANPVLAHPCKPETLTVIHQATMPVTWVRKRDLTPWLVGGFAIVAASVIYSSRHHDHTIYISVPIAHTPKPCK